MWHYLKKLKYLIYNYLKYKFLVQFYLDILKNNNQTSDFLSKFSFLLFLVNFQKMPLKNGMR